MKNERYKELLGNRADLLMAYGQTRDMEPWDTFETLVAMRDDIKQALICIAEAVNATSDDGRLCDEAKRWAASLDGAASKDELEQFHIYDITSYMHPTHLDQLARKVMKVNPDMYTKFHFVD